MVMSLRDIFNHINLGKILFGPLLSKVEWITGEMVHKILEKIDKLLLLPITKMIDADILQDARLTTPQLIHKYGYSVETHWTVTEDNYKLEFYRITGKQLASGVARKGALNVPDKKRVVLLQAGILDSSASWVITGTKKALGYKLSDAGYDVWLMNHRGVKGSRIKYQDNDPDNGKGDYWNFTFHEIGYYDLPAVIDYILIKTGHEKLTYIAHSQGCNSFLVMAAERPDYSKKVIEMHALAPSVFMNFTRNISMRVLTYLVPRVLRHFVTVFNVREMAPHNPLVVAVTETVCFIAALKRVFCNNMHLIFLGQRNWHIDDKIIPAILGHVPGNASIIQLFHFAQLIRTGKFQTYGPRHMRRDYKIEEIDVPIYIYYGQRDTLATKENAIKLHITLKIRKDIYEAKAYGHMDFLWADNTNGLYETIISRLHQSGQQNLKDYQLHEI